MDEYPRRTDTSDMQLTMSKEACGSEGHVNSLENEAYSWVFSVVLVPNDQEWIVFFLMGFFLVLWALQVFSIGQNGLDCALTPTLNFGLGDRRGVESYDRDILFKVGVCSMLRVVVFDRRSRGPC